jgi:hypothetical protein
MVVRLIVRGMRQPKATGEYLGAKCRFDRDPERAAGNCTVTWYGLDASPSGKRRPVLTEFNRVHYPPRDASTETSRRKACS